MKYLSLILPYLRWSTRLLGGLLVTVLLIGVAARWWITTDSGRSFIEARIERSAPPGLMIEVDNLRGNPLGAFTIDRIKILDPDGTWLEVERVSANWTPWSLIQRQLAIEDLSAGQIRFREPNLPVREAPETSSAPFPLKSIEVGKVSLPHITYVGSNLDPLSTFSLLANGYYMDEQFDIQADLTPLEGINDRVAVHISRLPDLPLEGTISARGDAGGWITRFLGLPETDTLALDLEASGTETDWHLTSKLSISGQDMVSLTGETSGSVTLLNGNILNTLPWLPAEIASRLSSETDLDIALTSLSEDTYTISAGLTSPAFNLQLSGQSQSNNNTIALSDVRVDLNIPDASELLSGTGLDLRQARYFGSANFTAVTELSFDGRFTLEDLHTKPVRAEQVSGPIQLGLKDTQLSIDAVAQAVNLLQVDNTGLPLLGANPRLELAAITNIDTGETDVERLALYGADLTLTARQQGPKLSGTLKSELESLGLGDGALFDGAFEALLASAEDITLDLRGALSGLAPEGVSHTSNLHEPIQIDLAVSSTGEEIRLTRLDARSNTLSLSANGALKPEGQLAGDVMASAQHIRLSETEHAAGLALRGHLSGSIETMTFDGQLSADMLSLGSFQLSDAELELEGRRSEDSLSTSLTLAASTEYGDLAASAAPSLAGTNWTTGELDLSLGNVAARGSFASPSIAPSDISGNLQLTGVPDTLPFDSLDLNLALNHGDLTLSGSAGITASSQFDTSDLTLALSGTPDEFTADIDLTTSHISGVRKLPVNLGAIISGGLEASQVSLELDGDYNSHPIRTDEPIRLDWSGANTHLKGQISAFAGTVAIVGQEDRGAPTGTIRLEDISLAGLTEAFGLSPITGTLGSVLKLDANDETRVISLSGEVLGISADSTDIEPINLSFNSMLDVQNLTANINLTGDNTTLTLMLNGTSDWANGVPGLKTDVPLNFSLNGATTIDGLSALVLPPEMVLSGLLRSNLQGQFLTSGPNATGHISLDDGRFEHGDFGLILANLSFDTEVDGDLLSVTALTAESQGNGEVDGSGTLSLSGQSRDEINVQLRDLLVLDRQDIDARASGTLTIHRENRTTLINGDLAIDRANVRLDRLVQASRPTLPVRFGDVVNDSASSEGPTRLDIRLNAPRRIFAEGYGLDAELSASARIQGTLQEPLISADAGIVRGDYSFAGQSFDLVQSHVALAAGSDEAALDIRAERRTTDLTAIVEITGSQTRPVITLSSEPALPDNEILSRMLFGLSPDQLTPIQAARLASTLASLAGGSGFDVLGRLENALFLDRLDLAEDQNGTAIITTGKYIRPNVYVEAENSLDGSVGVAVDWEPFDNITVRGEANPDDGQELSIRWRRDFDQRKRKATANEDDDD